MSGRNRLNGIGLVALACATGLVVCGSAAAKTYKPTTTADHAPNGCSRKDCTLREAITAANARHGKDKVVLKGGKKYKLSIPGGDEHQNATGDLNILDPLNITAKGKKPATVNAKGIDRVFRPESVVTFKNLKITGGNADGGGGGILMIGGKLKLIHCQLTRNKATNGAGIETGGDGGAKLIVNQSTIDHNTATVSDGAGLGIYVGNTAKIMNSTIAGNKSNSTTGPGEGGGIVVGGKATLIDDTIAGNSANDFGAGIATKDAGKVSLNGVTVAYNTADSDNDGGGGAGGIGESGGGVVTIRNSLVAANTAMNGFGPDCSPADPGGIVSAGHNLIGTTADCAAAPGPGDRVDLPLSTVKIGKLTANGGPTKTIELKGGSAAIGHADSHSPARDQRGVKRDSHPDIGAFERD